MSATFPAVPRSGGNRPSVSFAAQALDLQMGASTFFTDLYIAGTITATGSEGQVQLHGRNTSVLRLRSVSLNGGFHSLRSSSSGNSVRAMEPQAKVQKVKGSEEAGEKNGHTNGMHCEKVVVASQALRVKKLSPNAILPSRGSALAAGYDVSSAYETVLPARGKVLVKTDLSIAIPQGTYARVAPRSGLAWKHSIDVGAGVIDADYRGPVGVILFNHSDTDFTIKAGDRVAQLILELIVTPDVLEVDDLDATVRGEGGFGSTGVSLVVES